MRETQQTRKVSIESVERGIKDLAARHYMNALGHLNRGERDQAMYELGCAYGLRHLLQGVDHFADEGCWPADVPADDYVDLLDLITAVSDERSDDEPGAGVY